MTGVPCSEDSSVIVLKSNAVETSLQLRSGAGVPVPVRVAKSMPAKTRAGTVARHTMVDNGMSCVYSTP